MEVVDVVEQLNHGVQVRLESMPNGHLTHVCLAYIGRPAVRQRSPVVGQRKSAAIRRRAVSRGECTCERHRIGTPRVARRIDGDAGEGPQADPLVVQLEKIRKAADRGSWIAK